MPWEGCAELGCKVDPRLRELVPRGQDAGFTQPRAHLIAHLYTLVMKRDEGNVDVDFYFLSNIFSVHAEAHHERIPTPLTQRAVPRRLIGRQGFCLRPAKLKQ